MIRFVIFFLLILLVGFCLKSIRSLLANWEWDTGRRVGPWHSGGDPEARYSSILELKERPTPENVRRNYRELIAKYHPDKVQHLGTEFQQIAERKTQEINEAYRYFRKKLRF